MGASAQILIIYPIPALPIRFSEEPKTIIVISWAWIGNQISFLMCPTYEGVARPPWRSLAGQNSLLRISRETGGHFARMF
jgi:hypothetical protein